MRVITIFLALAMLGTACQEPLTESQKKQVAQIDTLLYVADSLHTAMEVLNDSAIAKDLEEVEVLYKTIASANPDSANKRFWVQDVNRLELVYSSYKKYLRDKESIKSKLATSRQQLETLKNSVIDAKLDSAQAANYLQEEAQALANANFKFNKRQPNAVVAEQVWDTAQTHFRQMARRIKQKQK
jgi:hypothetical protein